MTDARIWTLAALLLSAAGASSQPARPASDEPPAQRTLSGTTIGPFTLNGMLTLQAEGYGTSGVPARRDPFSSQGALQFTASAGGKFTYGANLVFSTQQVRFGQSTASSLNRGSVDLGYEWVRVSAGNVVPRLSKYVAQDVAVNGALVELAPGPFRVTAGGGRARSASDGLSTPGLRPTYARSLYAAQAGVGEERRTHLHLFGLFGSDDASSLPTPGLRLTPSENVNLGVRAGISVLDQALTIRGNGAVSGFTRDVTVTGAPVADAVPDLLSGLFTVNSSTKATYAGELEAEFRLPTLQLGGAYERVQPGFESMGLTRARDDRETIRLQGRTRLANRRVQIGGRFSQTQNNLLGVLDGTSTRRRLAAMGQVQISDALSSSASYTAAQAKLTPTDSVGVGRDLTTHTLTVSPTYAFGESVRQTVAVGLITGWRSGTAAPAGGAAPDAFRNLTATASHNVALPSRLTVGTNASVRRAEISGLTNSGAQLATRLSRPFLNNQLTLTVSAGYTYTRNERPQALAQVAHRQQIGADAQWRAPIGGDLSFSARVLNASTGTSGFGTAAGSYREFQTRVAYRRKL